MPSPRYARLFTALLLTLAATARAQPIDFDRIDPADHAHHRWYLDTIDDQPSGYWHDWLTVEDGVITTGYEIVGAEKHAGELTRTRTRVVWTETLVFKPISIVVETQNGSDTFKRTYHFTDTAIKLISEQNGRSSTRELPPIKDAFLTAAQLEIVARHYASQSSDDFELNMLEPMLGLKTCEVRYKKSAQQDESFMRADKSQTSATRWDVTFDFLPGFESVRWTDDKGRLVGFAFDLGGMRKVSRLADKRVAEMKLDPPEMAGRSVVVLDRPIRKARKQRRIVYELRYDAGDSGLVPATTPHQSVERLGNGRARVTVDLDKQPDPEDQAAQDPPTEAHRAASIMIDYRDPAVRQLAEKAVARLDIDATPGQVAQACKRVVGGHFVGGAMTVGDASASEAARTRRGDCTEHAVLLAALLRAHGIPSRCVTGLVYSEEGFAGTRNAFVYHMWTQAWIESGDGGAWVDLDSAVGRYSAGHLALSVSAMGDNDQADRIRLIPMTRNLAIKVLKTSD